MFNPSYVKNINAILFQVGLLLQGGRIDAIVSGSLAAEVPAEHYVVCFQLLSPSKRE